MMEWDKITWNQNIDYDFNILKNNVQLVHMGNLTRNPKQLFTQKLF